MTHFPRAKILIVDDRSENLFALQKLLNVLDVEIFQASTGENALGLVLEHDFFVAILDVQMPGMDGYELAELLRGNQSTATLPIIFVSAVYSDEYHHRKGYEAGAVDFISKPFVPEILISKIKVFLDLSEQRHALETMVAQLNRTNGQLELVNQELETLTYSISHDLRAPLRAIDGFARMLAEELQGPLTPADEQGAQRYVEVVRDNARQMNEMIDSLLQFSRLAFAPLSSRTIEMKALAEYVIQDTLLANPERQVELSLAELPAAWGDPLFIKQVIEHLLQNAFKYSRKREKACVEIGFQAHGAQIAYFVRDNGVGFDMFYAGKLFSLFQRMHASSEFEGTGVGLANVRRIILRHGGEVWADAKVDSGATFYFTLPQSAP